MPLSKLTTSGELPALAGDASLKPLGGGTPATNGGGVNKTAVGVGAAAVGGVAALALHNPSMAGKIARGLNTLRQQLMLSGFALPKSLLGNAGAAVEQSLERGSMRPLSEMFSGQTVKDAMTAFKAGAPGGAAQTGQAPTGGNMVTKALSYISPGRAMGAFDEAAQKALQRAGLSADEAQTAAMQAPLQQDLAEALDSPIARYVHPFRRQPFNQFIEGWKKLKPENLKAHPLVTAGYTAAGATHGAATADDPSPMSVPLAVAGSARYGLPYAAAALLGRVAAQGQGGGNIASSALPVSEYGFESSMTDPTRPFRKPAALTALDKLLGP